MKGAALEPMPSAAARDTFLARFELLNRAHRHALAQGAQPSADAGSEFRF